MKYEIKADEDETFKVINPASTGDECIGEEYKVEVVPEKIEPPTPPQKMPKPVPIDNPRSSGMSWFEGTSWSTKQ